MGISFSYTLIPASSASPGASATAVGTPTLGAPVDPFSQQDILDLFDRLLPSWYLDPLKSPGPGYELLQAFAAGAARASEAVVNLGRGGYILSATGGAKALAYVSFSRDSATAGAVRVKAGTVVTTSKTGRDFVTLEDAVFGGSDLGPKTVRAEAIAESYQWNVRGPRTAKDGTALPGDIDTIKTPLLEPPAGDFSLQVTQVGDAVGGIAGTLDQLGADRGLPRYVGESDDRYRVRLRQLPDVISPDAVQRALEALLDALGATYYIVETWAPGFQSCWNANNELEGECDPNLFVWNDPRDNSPMADRWLDINTMAASFIVVVAPLEPISEHGFAWNDPGNEPSDWASLSGSGTRAYSAWNPPDDPDDNPACPCWNGVDLGVEAVYAGLYDLLQAIKAAGTYAVLWLDGQ